MRYLFTGSAERNKKIPDSAIERIVARCTELSPVVRYQSASALKKALLKYKKKAKRRYLSAAAGIILFAFLLTIFTSIRTADRFIEPVEMNENIVLPFFEVSEVEFKEFALIPFSGHTSHLRTSGTSSFDFVEGRGLRFYNRTQNFDALDFSVAGLPPGEYTLEVEMSSDFPVFFSLNTADEPYFEIADSEENMTSFTFQYDLNVFRVNGVNMAAVYNVNNDRFSYQERIRIQAGEHRANTQHDFYIKSIRVYDV
jgi:hypothetical protein